MLKRSLATCLILAVTTVAGLGCSAKTTTERKDEVKSPGGTTTTIDTHSVESSGKNPPTNANGERAK